MLSLIGWIVYGIIVGAIAKWILPNDKEPQGFLAMISVGVLGSFIGGGLNYLLTGNGSPIQKSGFIFGIIGAVILCLLLPYVKKLFKKD